MTHGAPEHRHIVLSATATYQGSAQVDYVQCSDAESDGVSSDEDENLHTMRGLPFCAHNKQPQRQRGPLDGAYAEWMYAMRKYVRRDDDVSLLGLLRQCHISLDCQPYFNEKSNNEPVDLTLERLDSWSHAVSVRDFINGKPGPEEQVLECLVGRGSTKCQVAIIGLEGGGEAVLVT